MIHTLVRCSQAHVGCEAERCQDPCCKCASGSPSLLSSSSVELLSPSYDLISQVILISVSNVFLLSLSTSISTDQQGRLRWITWNRRLLGYHRLRVSNTKYWTNGITNRHNIINSNRNTYRQISFRCQSCTAQDRPNGARISKIFCARPQFARNRPSLQYKSFFNFNTIQNRNPHDSIAIYCPLFSTFCNEFDMVWMSHCWRLKMTLFSAMLREAYAVPAVCFDTTRYRSIICHRVSVIQSYLFIVSRRFLFPITRVDTFVLNEIIARRRELLHTHGPRTRLLFADALRRTVNRLQPQI